MSRKVGLVLNGKRSTALQCVTQGEPLRNNGSWQASFTSRFSSGCCAPIPRASPWSRRSMQQVDFLSARIGQSKKKLERKDSLSQTYLKSFDNAAEQVDNLISV